MTRSTPPAPDKFLQVLSWLGSCSLVGYLAILALSFSFDYGEGFADRPILSVLACFGLLSGMYVAAVILVRRHFRNHQESELALERRVWKRIVLFAILFRLALLPSNPIQEIDYYRYLWDGRVTSHGHNPYSYSPEQIEKQGTAAEPESELFQLHELSQESKAVATIFRRIHFRHVPTVYPPFAQAVFAASAWSTPADALLWLHILILKAVLTAFDLGTHFILARLLRACGLPGSWAIIYGWCPLLVKEIANSGHLDSIAVFFTTLSVYCLVLAIKGQRRKLFWSCFSLASLALATLSKCYPVILLPLYSAILWKHGRHRIFPCLGVFAATVVLGYSLFWRPPTTIATPAADGTHHPWTGLRTFLTYWQKNDLLFMILHENLRLPTEQPDHWFVFVPRLWRAVLHERTQPIFAKTWDPQADPAFLCSQLLMATLMGVLVLRWSCQVLRDPAPRTFLERVFLVLIWLWLLSSAQNPWYFLWALPFLAFARARSWLLLPVLGFVYYLSFWLEYQALESESTLRAARALFDFTVVWFEFGPFFLALMAERTWLWWTARDGRESAEVADMLPSQEVPDRAPAPAGRRSGPSE